MDSQSERIDPTVLAALRARHIAFIKDRLLGEEAEATFREHVAGGFRALMKARVSELWSAEQLEAIVESMVKEGSMRDMVRPIAKAMSAMEINRLREEPASVSELVPPKAQEALKKLAQGRNAIPDRVIREIVTHEAVETGMRDVLSDGLKEFYEKVNPLTSDWGLLSLMKKFSPFGLGPMAKSFQSVQKEFDKRLEPEMRKFIAGFSRRALNKMSDFVIDNADEPSFVTMRLELLSWVLEQPVGDLCSGLSDDNTALIEEVVHETTLHALTEPKARRRRQAWISMALSAHQGQSLEEAMAMYGVTYQPDLDALADALWPVVRTVIEDPTIWKWVESLVTDFYDAEASA